MTDTPIFVPGIFVLISQHQGSKQDGIHWPKTCAGSGDEIMDTPDTGRRHTDVLSISYPESSGSLASGWSPGKTLENCFDWLPRNSLH